MCSSHPCNQSLGVLVLFVAATTVDACRLIKMRERGGEGEGERGKEGERTRNTKRVIVLKGERNRGRKVRKDEEREKGRRREMEKETERYLVHLTQSVSWSSCPFFFRSCSAADMLCRCALPASSPAQTQCDQ